MAFEQIALPNLDAAYRLALWLVRDPHLAEEVVQDAITRALSYFASFRGGNGRAWLMRIVRNTAYTALAVRRDTGRVLEEQAPSGVASMLDVPDPGDDPEAALVRREDAARVDQALASLPVELRECLVLKELEELSYKEIAEITGVPVGTVMSRLWRARRALIGSTVEATGHEP